MGAILAWENAAEGPLAEISTSSEAQGLGIRSVLTPQIADVWRSGNWTYGDEITLTVDLGAVRTDLRLFLLAAPRDGRLPHWSSQVRLYAAETLAGLPDAPLYADFVSASMAPNGLWVQMPDAPVTARFVQWKFTAGTEDTYLQLGRVWIGPALISTRGISYGQQRGATDAGSNDRAGLSGVRYATRGGIYRTAAWSFPNLRQADAEALDAAALAVGTTGQVFASPFHETPARSGLLGHFTAPPAPKAASFQRWSADISVEEDL